MTWLDAQADNDMNSQVHERNLMAREEGSCKWLLTHPTFHDWLNAEGEGIQSKLWLRGPPGIGKSFLCSTAIAHVSHDLDCITLYHLCRFDDQFGSGAGVDDPSSGVRAATLLVHQLFQHFWQQDRQIAMPVSAYIKTVNKTMSSLTEATRLIIRHGYGYAREKGRLSHAESLRLFIFLDGLDENGDTKAGAKVLQLFDNLEKELPVIQKTWISSREKYALSQLLREWPFISGDDLTEADVKEFLAKSVPNFGSTAEAGREVDGQPSKNILNAQLEPTQNLLTTLHIVDDWILEKLQMRAKGNFLYARLMVNWLKDDVFTVDDIMDLLVSRVPDKITEMYRRIFLQYQRDQHKYTR